MGGKELVKVFGKRDRELKRKSQEGKAKREKPRGKSQEEGRR